MQIFENDLSSYPRNDNSIVTVGTFDGLHIGHRRLIERVVKSGSPSTVVTFYPHPQMVVARPGRELKLLTLPEEKVKMLREMGLERMVVLQFDRNLMNMNADEFLKEILIKKIGLRKIVIGYDHAFGKDRKGKKDFLIEQGKLLGFETEIVEPQYCRGKIVSSTLIRRALENGEISSVSEYLGRNYTFSGWVIKGADRGKILGFPTANLKIKSPQKLLPSNGVYAVLAHFLSQKLTALLYIGTRPTYGSGDLSIEVYLIDFIGDDLYGEEMTVELIARLRDDILFATEADLVAQIKKDEKRGQEILSKYNLSNAL